MLQLVIYRHFSQLNFGLNDGYGMKILRNLHSCFTIRLYGILFIDNLSNGFRKRLTLPQTLNDLLH